MTFTFAVMAAATAGWLIVRDGPAIHRLLRVGGQHVPLGALVIGRVKAQVMAGALAVRRRSGFPWEEAAIELCQGLSAEMAAGRTSSEAMRRAVAVLDPSIRADLAEVVAVAREGGDVGPALARASSATSGLPRLAAAWQVGVANGGALRPLVDQVAVALRDARTHRQDVAAQLAGPRATARMLAALPLVGLLMGTALGADPVAFLLGSPAGLGCLILGLTLNVAGLLWTRRMVASAEAAGSLW